MKQISKRDILPQVHEILRKKYGELIAVSGQGIAKGERVEWTEKGKRVRCIIKTSSGGRISFGRHDDGKWSGLDESDYVVVVAPERPLSDGLMVSMLRHDVVRKAFDENYAAQVKAGMGKLPNWIAPFHEEGRGARGKGDGFGEQALWSEPLSSIFSSPGLPYRSKQSLTIQQAKQQLAESFGVPVEAVEITIKA